MLFQALRLSPAGAGGRCFKRCAAAAERWVAAVEAAARVWRSAERPSFASTRARHETHVSKTLRTDETARVPTRQRPESRASILPWSCGFCCRREVSPTLLPSVDECSGGTPGTRVAARLTSPNTRLQKSEYSSQAYFSAVARVQGPETLDNSRERRRYHSGGRACCPTARTRVHAPGVGLAAAAARSTKCDIGWGRPRARGRS